MKLQRFHSYFLADEVAPNQALDFDGEDTLRVWTGPRKDKGIKFHAAKLGISFGYLDRVDP